MRGRGGSFLADSQRARGNKHTYNVEDIMAIGSKPPRRYCSKSRQLYGKKRRERKR
jgi:hypothetical protein